MTTYRVCVNLAAAQTEQEEADFERFDLESLDAAVSIEADTFGDAKEQARDYIARELEKRGLRPEKSGETEAVDGYDGTRFVCEFYGFDAP